MEKVGADIKIDSTKNILNGYPVGTFNSGGESVDSEEFQDQLSGGNYKAFLGGAIDGGDITFNTYFEPSKGKPNIPGIVKSKIITPQFTLILAIVNTIQAGTGDILTLQPFYASGVNYSGGAELKGDLGKAIGSSLKFKISGEPIMGTTDLDPIAYSYYEGVSTGA
jgi:hypothetical protein